MESEGIRGIAPGSHEAKMRHVLMSRYVTMGRHMCPSKVPLFVGI